MSAFISLVYMRILLEITDDFHLDFIEYNLTGMKNKLLENDAAFSNRKISKIKLFYPKVKIKKKRYSILKNNFIQEMTAFC